MENISFERYITVHHKYHNLNNCLLFFNCENLIQDKIKQD
jgi:hypothetical protein